MKKFFNTSALIFAFYLSYAQTNLFNNPESVVYDSKNSRYLVSNNGNGKIVQIDSLGVQTCYPMGITATKLAGLYIKDSLLFAASCTGAKSGIIVLNLNTGDSVALIKPAGLNFINDITTDNNGFIYATEYNANKIFKIRLSDFSSWTYVSAGLSLPNGILFDDLHNRLLVMCEGSKKVVAVNLQDSTITTVLNTGLSGTDGLIMDNRRNFYISDWTTNSVYKYDSLFQNRIKIGGTYNDPADIYYDKIHNKIAVPCYSSNLVQFIDLTALNTDEINLNNNSGQLLIYPNPTYDKLFISINCDDMCLLNIINESGKEVFRKNLNITKNTELNISDFKAGKYIIQLKTSTNKIYTGKFIINN